MSRKAPKKSFLDEKETAEENEIPEKDPPGFVPWSNPNELQATDRITRTTQDPGTSGRSSAGRLDTNPGAEANTPRRRLSESIEQTRPGAVAVHGIDGEQGHHDDGLTIWDGNDEQSTITSHEESTVHVVAEAVDMETESRMLRERDQAVRERDQAVRERDQLRQTLNNAPIITSAVATDGDVENANNDDLPRSDDPKCGPRGRRRFAISAILLIVVVITVTLVVVLPSEPTPSPLTTTVSTVQPTPTVPTAQPTTTTPTAQPTTTAPTAQPTTIAPTAQPTTTAPTAQPTTAAPTAQQFTTAPSAQQPTAAGQEGACPLTMWVFEDSKTCQSSSSGPVTPMATGTIYADNGCHTVEPSSNADLFPGTYKAACTSDSAVTFNSSGCNSSECTDSSGDGRCDLDDRTISAFYSTLRTQMVVLDPSTQDEYIPCPVMSGTGTLSNLSVTFAIFGDCSVPECQ